MRSRPDYEAIGRAVWKHYRKRAIAKVAAAIKWDELPSPYDKPCAYCGRPAETYDHRDYADPLNVKPCCSACNVTLPTAQLDIAVITSHLSKARSFPFGKHAISKPEPPTMTPSEAGAMMGAKGGRSKSPAKIAAAIENLKLGGRPLKAPGRHSE